MGRPEGDYWERVFAKAPDLVTRAIAGEAIVVPIRGKLIQLEQVFALNPVGAFIWDLLDGARPLSEIRRRVLAAFDTSDAVAEADIREFVESLRDINLIQEA
jgi:hypothetical protein